MAFTKPTNVNTWDTNETNVVVPDAAHQSDGWVDGEAPPAGFFNSLQNTNYQWFRWIDERMVDGDSNISAGYPSATFSGPPEDTFSVVNAAQGSSLVLYGGEISGGTDSVGNSVVVSAGTSTGNQGSFVAIGGAIGGASGTSPRQSEEHLVVGNGVVSVVDDLSLVFNATGQTARGISLDSLGGELVIGDAPGTTADTVVEARSTNLSRVASVSDPSGFCEMVADPALTQCQATFTGGNSSLIRATATTASCIFAGASSAEALFIASSSSIQVNADAGGASITGNSVPANNVSLGTSSSYWDNTYSTSYRTNNEASTNLRLSHTSVVRGLPLSQMELFYTESVAATVDVGEDHLVYTPLRLPVSCTVFGAVQYVLHNSGGNRAFSYELWEVEQGAPPVTTSIDSGTIAAVPANTWFSIQTAGFVANPDKMYILRVTKSGGGAGAAGTTAFQGVVIGLSPNPGGTDVTFLQGG